MDKNHLVRTAKDVAPEIAKAAEGLRELPERDALVEAVRRTNGLLKSGDTVIGGTMDAPSKLDLDEILARGEGTCSHFSTVTSEILWAAGIPNALGIARVDVQNLTTGEPVEFGVRMGVFGFIEEAHVFNIALLKDGSTAIVDPLWNFAIFHDCVYDTRNGKKHEFTKDGGVEFDAKTGDRMRVSYFFIGINYSDGHRLEGSPERPMEVRFFLVKPGTEGRLLSIEGGAYVWPAEKDGRLALNCHFELWDITGREKDNDLINEQILETLRKDGYVNAFRPVGPKTGE